MKRIHDDDKVCNIDGGTKRPASTKAEEEDEEEEVLRRLGTKDKSVQKMVKFNEGRIMWIRKQVYDATPTEDKPKGEKGKPLPWLDYAKRYHVSDVYHAVEFYHTVVQMCNEGSSSSSSSSSSSRREVDKEVQNDLAYCILTMDELSWRQWAIDGYIQKQKRDLMVMVGMKLQSRYQERRKEMAARRSTGSGKKKGT